ncbi:MAG: hypothetical protein A2754_01290 [Candidatus Magasanikbacteria bacterium RIFCSPHIGHO2_01_FULL_47_8]|uniref:Uncharacterized protein n=1 Tax=Candidatus Magasanikbacteria bacterium RIFCSPHIGHO2_01_FULL_47_8 TaxID=1798673 RepID=A0A1F6MDQ1_9BACT|nr:MAG: hypothetical protein A2754_01290 [Candidatus Magasanikbacteria bacterium RIFCSPHIGHO2_01_FULL_47_8]
MKGCRASNHDNALVVIQTNDFATLEIYGNVAGKSVIKETYLLLKNTDDVSAILAKGRDVVVATPLVFKDQILAKKFVCLLFHKGQNAITVVDQLQRILKQHIEFN